MYTSQFRLSWVECGGGSSVAMLAAFLLAGLVLVTGENTTTAPPNIIFLLTDDQGWADTGFTNPASPMHTPNIGTQSTWCYVLSGRARGTTFSPQFLSVSNEL